MKSTNLRKITDLECIIQLHCKFTPVLGSTYRSGCWCACVRVLRENRNDIDVDVDVDVDGSLPTSKCKWMELGTVGPLLLPLPLYNASSPNSGAICFRFRLPYDIYGAHHARPTSCPLLFIQSVAGCLTAGTDILFILLRNGKLRG